MKEPTSVVHFDSESHTYTSSTNSIIPGVTTILGSTVFAGQYSNVSSDVLKRASERGTRIHEAFEFGTDFFLANAKERRVYQDLVEIVKKANLTNIKHETLVYYLPKGAKTPLWCGIVDIISDEGIFDVKTTAEIKSEYVKWQTSFYYWACVSMGIVVPAKGGGFFVNANRPAKFIPNNMYSEEEVLEVYYEHVKNKSEEVG